MSIYADEVRLIENEKADNSKIILLPFADMIQLFKSGWLCDAVVARKIRNPAVSKLTTLGREFMIGLAIAYFISQFVA